jgi:hypothetical protein
MIIIVSSLCSPSTREDHAQKVRLVVVLLRSGPLYTDIYQCTCDLCCDSNSLPLPKGMEPYRLCGVCGGDGRGGIIVQSHY